jgi:hypothetical protein
MPGYLCKWGFGETRVWGEVTFMGLKSQHPEKAKP